MSIKLSCARRINSRNLLCNMVPVVNNTALCTSKSAKGRSRVRALTAKQQQRKQRETLGGAGCVY